MHPNFFTPIMSEDSSTGHHFCASSSAWIEQVASTYPVEGSNPSWRTKRVSSRQEVIHVSRTSGSSGQLDAPSDDRAESTQPHEHC